VYTTSKSPSRTAGRFVQVRADEPSLGEAELVGQPAGELDRGAAEIGPGDPRAETGPGQRVDPEMALEVEQVAPGDVADLGDLEVPQPDAASLEALEVVERRRGVDGRPLVPQGLVLEDRLARAIRRLVIERPAAAHSR